MLQEVKNIKENKFKVIGIDATNIIIGGGATHLKNLINYFLINLSSKYKLVIFCNDKFSFKKKNKNLKFIYIGKFLSSKPLWRLFWVKFFLPKKIEQNNCDILFIPGGIAFKNSSPTTVMFRNLQPFQISPKTLYGLSLSSLRIIFLRFLLINSFKTSDRIIFLSNHAKKIIQKKILIKNKYKIINHGVNFSGQISYNKINIRKTISIVYVSSIEKYKNHINVLKAIALLKRDFKVKLTLIGSFPEKKNYEKVRAYINEIDPKNSFIQLKGNLEHKILMKTYKDYDLGIHASSCENFPNIVIEMLSKNLPVITSRIPVMKEILGKNFIFFNENNHLDIYQKIKKYINSRKYTHYLNKRVNFFKSHFSKKKQMETTFRYLVNE
jgi:glycosyltransferase involved in cell wall biosynthesis